MDKINACIISFFMSNLSEKTVKLQHEVVAKRNPQKYPHYAIHTDLRHGASMDLAWCLNGQPHPTFNGQNVPKRFDHDVILFLDIDALPCNQYAIQHYVEMAAEGALIGNIQRSNHIENNQHVFAAPSAVACSVETMKDLGFPSALETRRADVGEEYTFAAEERKVHVELVLPLRFDEAPAECPSWALKDGMPVYGRGTTFGFSEYNDADGEITNETFWHLFQSFHPGQQEKFWAKCEQELKKDG